MTFPSLGGNLTDPWVDGALVNAAAMKTNTTDKLNALADSLLAKTARVSATVTLSPTTYTTGIATQVPLTAITQQTGGTWSLASNQITLPGPGIYMIKAVYTVDAMGTYRNFMSVGEPTLPITTAKLAGRQGLIAGEDTYVVLGFHIVTGLTDNKLTAEIYYISAGTRGAYTGTLRIVKVSD